jgi:hypothetical protein
MKLSNRIFNNPDIGSYNHRAAVVVLDSDSSDLPTDLTVDAIVLEEGDRALFTALSDSSLNNRVYKVHKGQLELAVDGLISDGMAAPGDALFIKQGTHAGELWGYEDDSWRILDVDINNAGGSGGVSDVNSITGSVSIVAGSGISVTPSGNNLTISASGGSGANTSLSNLTTTNITEDLNLPTKFINARGLRSNYDPTKIGIDMNNHILADVFGNGMLKFDNKFAGLQLQGLGWLNFVKLLTAGNVSPATDITIIPSPGQSLVVGDGGGVRGSLKLRTSGGDIEIKTLNSISGSYSLTLPPDTGTSGQTIENDGTGILSFTSSLKDSSGALSIKYDSGITGRTLYDAGGVVSLQWQTRSALDSSANPSIDWENRVALDNSSRQSVDWVNRVLLSQTESVVLNWDAKAMLDSTGQDSINWENRHLKDQSNVDALSWVDRELRATDGSTALDWQGPGSMQAHVHLLPLDNDVQNLGDVGQEWNNVYANNVVVTTDVSAATVTPANGASGTFTTVDSKTVTVTNGIITSIV